MKINMGLYSGIMAIQLGCGNVEAETLIPLIQDYQVQSGDYVVTVYKASLPAKAVARMHSSPTILKQEKPSLRARILLGASTTVYPGLVVPALPALPEHTTIELQILTPIDQAPNDFITYLNLVEAP